MTGRDGNVRPISVKPAAKNIANVPVKTAEADARPALSAITSTGCPSTDLAPWAKAKSTAARNSDVPTPSLRACGSTAKQVMAVVGRGA